MRLRLRQTLSHRGSLSTDRTQIDYEESEDESILRSPLLLSNIGDRRLSSSAGIYSNSSIQSDHSLP